MTSSTTTALKIKSAIQVQPKKIVLVGKLNLPVGFGPNENKTDKNQETVTNQIVEDLKNLKIQNSIVEIKTDTNDNIFENNDDDDDDNDSIFKKSSKKTHKNETSEEKKLRKALVKESNKLKR